MVLGQARRAQQAVQAAAESDAHLLQFLRDFGADAARAASAQLAAATNRLAGGPRAARRAQDVWAPPLASERYEWVPFKPLAIVPLPVTRRALAAAAGAPLPPPPGPEAGVDELLPVKRSRRPRQRSWKQGRQELA